MPTFRFENRIPVSTGDPITDIANLRTTMYDLVENLHYMFGNLGTENLGGSLNTYLEDTVAGLGKSLNLQVDVDGIVTEVIEKSALGELSSKVELTAEGLEKVITRVETVEKNYITGEDVDSILLTSYNITTETATSFNRRIGETESDIDDLIETVSDQYTEITQSIDGISLSVKTANGTTSVKLADGALDLTGLVTFSDLSTSGKTTINGSNITTGTINADLITAGTLKSIAIEGVTITGSSLRSEEVSGGYTYFVSIDDGQILGGKYPGILPDSSGVGFIIGGDEIAFGTYGDLEGSFYVDNKVFCIDGHYGIKFDVGTAESGIEFAAPVTFSGESTTFSGNVSLSTINSTSFPGGFSISQFSNNAIAMATAYTTTSGTSGGADIPMTAITEKDTVGTFSRARYSNSYGYGIRCTKAGYYMISAHAVLYKTSTTTTTNTLAIRSVVGGTSSFIARNSVFCTETSGLNYTQDIAPIVVYLSANTYLSLYCSDSGLQSTTQGAYITAVYLGI